MRKGQIIGLGRTAEILAWDDDKVLKLFRGDWPPSAVKWEEKVARTVFEAGLPVPAVYGIVEEKGRHGILYDRVDGSSMLVELTSQPEKLKHYADLFASLHADMHSLEVEELPSQHQQLEDKIRSVKSLTEDLKQAALEALNILSDGNNLCHGDYHPDNIQMSPQGPVIIDWNDATRGVPEADIARTLLLLQKGQLPSHLRFDVEETQSIRARFVNAYMRKYSTTRSISMEEVESWQLPVMAARLSEGMKKKRVIS